MREKMVPLVIMLSAGAITSVLCIWKQFDTLYSLKVLLAVLIGFYLLGLLARKLYRKVLAAGDAVAEEEEDNGGETDEEEKKEEQEQ